jgi:hypothetical protein
MFDFLNPLSLITGSLERAYARYETAQTDTQKIQAQVEIQIYQAKANAVIAASANDRWFSVRSLMGYAVVIVVWKLLVWDTVFGWGITLNPGNLVIWIMVTIIGFYFVSRTAETIASQIAGTIGRKG